MGKIILIHGTFDGDETETGDRWWQKGGAMRADLEAAGHEVEAFRWSGENSDVARMKAAKALAKQLTQTGGDITLLAHSHGGNVAREALAMTKGKVEASIKTVSVGTPFIDRVPPFAQNLLGWESVVIVLLILGLFFFEPLTGRHFETATDLSDNEMMRLYFFAGVAWAALFGWRAFRNRAKTYAAEAAHFLPVTHTMDEAVSMLQMADRQKIEAATPGSARRTLRLSFMPLVYLGMAAAVGWVLYYFFSRWETSSDEWQVLLVLVPVAAAAAYFGGIIINTLLSFPLGLVAPHLLNGLVQSTIKSSSLGLDSGAHSRRVGPSPTKGMKIPTLPPALEREIADHANQALSDRVGLLRELLTGASQNGVDPMAALDETFTWDELIHTAYFRVPNCRAFILEKVSKAQRAS